MNVRRLAASTLAAVALLTGCTVTRSLDTNRLETEIATELEAQTGVPAASVVCPDDVPIEQGHNFECTATDETGQTATIAVTQTDDEGNVHWEVEG
jgi:hypothetical protein